MTTPPGRRVPPRPSVVTEAAVAAAFALPPRVEPLGDATEAYDFDWALAEELLDDLAAVADQAGTTLSTRESMLDRIGDWSGPFRNGHDTALADRCAEAADLLLDIPRLAQAVVDAAHDVNEEQTSHNRKYLENAFDIAHDEARGGDTELLDALTAEYPDFEAHGTIN
jgi:hypothetical protein